MPPLPFRRNRTAITAGTLAIVGLPTSIFFVGLPLSFLAVILGIIALVQIKKDPYRGGKGFAVTGIVMGSLTIVLVPLLVFGFLYYRESDRRISCARNLNVLIKSLNIYSGYNNDSFPIVQFSPYSASLNNPTGTAIGDQASVYACYRGSGSANQAGSPPACLWLLVVGNMLKSEWFICPSDPAASGPAATTDASGRWYSNFQSGSQLSYSIGYPWTGDGKVNWHWRSTVDQALPVLSDIAPLNGTGTPKRVTNGPENAPPNTLNSANHYGDGQNVAFADSHLEWHGSAYVGNIGYKFGIDNIWTIGPGEGTPIVPGPLSVPMPSSEDPIARGSNKYDVVMVPVRNATTGGM